MPQPAGLATAGAAAAAAAAHGTRCGLALRCLLLALLAAAPASTQQTPAQRAAARWREHYRQRQAALAAGRPLPAPSSAEPAAGEFAIPVPAPGVDVPAETQMPLFSPDQLRIRHKLIPGVPLEGQVVSLAEQMQQAAALNLSLTKEQLDSANPLLGPLGPVDLPERRGPAEWEDGYVALCAIVKDQAADLREWLEYHAWLGVSKVYVYDNNSTEPLASAIADFLHSGFVEYAFFTGMPRYRDLFRTSSQWWAYNDCVHRYRHRHRWLGFIDVDEFIVVKQPGLAATPRRAAAAAAAGVSSSTGSASAGASSTGGGVLDAFMAQYEPYGGLALNWVIFGSSGHMRRPRGGVLVNYHACLPGPHEQNTHVKVLANTAHLLTMGDDPHRVYYTDDRHTTVNEAGEPVTQARSASPSHARVALHHYLTKSEAEYMAKMRRGSAAGNYKAPEFFATINAFATATCPAAMGLGLQCCPSVRAALGPDGVARVRARVAALGGSGGGGGGGGAGAAAA